MMRRYLYSHGLNRRLNELWLSLDENELLKSLAQGLLPCIKQSLSLLSILQEIFLFQQSSRFCLSLIK